MEYVWFEDLSTSMHDKSSIEENMKNTSEYNYEDLVWFENSKKETKTNHELPSDEANGNSKDVLNNKAEEMDKNENETLGTIDMLTNSGTVEDITGGIERYLGGFLFSHVGMDNNEPHTLDYYDQERGQYNKRGLDLKGENTTIAKENSDGKLKNRKKINDLGSAFEAEPEMQDVDEHGIKPPGINPF